MKAKLIKKTTGIYKIECDGKLIASTDDDMNKHLEISKLSLKNCQAIERGYDLDELAKTIFLDKIFTTNEEYEIPIDGFPYQWGFKVGFQKALELMGDKKFSEDDVKLSIDMSKDIKYVTYSRDEIIQSLQQTEWDVEIEMEKVIDETKIIGAVKGVKGSGSKITTYKSVPKLDADGWLILKRL